MEFRKVYQYFDGSWGVVPPICGGALPSTLNPADPAATASPSLGDDEIRALKNYLIDVLGVPNNVAVNPGANTPAFSISTGALMTVNWSPFTVPTQLIGTASQVLRISSAYSIISFEVNGGSMLALYGSGLLMQTPYLETVSGVTMTLGTRGPDRLTFRTNAVDTWAIDRSGMLLPIASAIDIGTPTGRVQNLYVANLNVQGTSAGLDLYGAKGIAGAVNLRGNNGATEVSYELTADLVTVRNVSHVLQVFPATNAITCNISSGPVFNGRDQAADFDVNTWLHFYWIANASNLASITSLTQPPQGPTLPSGYVDQGYIGALRFNGSSAISATRIRGNQAYYGPAQLVYDGTLLSGIATNMVVGTIVPSNALAYTVSSVFKPGTGTDTGMLLGVATNAWIAQAGENGAITDSLTAELPNVNNTFVISQTGGGTTNVRAYVQSYIMPNNSS